VQKLDAGREVEYAGHERHVDDPFTGEKVFAEQDMHAVNSPLIESDDDL
jgi:hypothetical protein